MGSLSTEFLDDTGNHPFATVSGTNPTYHNIYALNMHIASTDSINILLRNAVDKTTTINQFFPSVNTGQAGYKNKIGYLPSVVNETSITLSTTQSAINSVTRMSLSSGATQIDPPLIGNIITFNGNSLTTYDPMFNPYTKYLHADVSGITDLQKYVLPVDPATIFTTGTPKYFGITASTTTDIKSINPPIQLNLGSYSSDNAYIHNVWVAWKGNGNGPFGLYDASIEYTQTGGCRCGFSGSQRIWQVSINNNARNSYSGGGYVRFVVKFDGVIDMSQIRIE